MSINQSHPEKAEREVQTFSCDTILRDSLRLLREQPGWSNNVIAKGLGVNVSIVSQYLNDNGNVYPGNIPKLELKIADLLKNDARRRASGVETTVCNSSEQVNIALEYIRKTNDVGVLIDESGDGKSRGQEVYVKEHPTAILYRTFAWSCAKKSAENFMFEIAGKTDYDNRTARAIHAITKLRGSNRLIIVDDAHFLHHTALQWWIHFHEATQMPMALVGLPALLKKIEADAQIFSRVGLRFRITKTDDKGAVIIDRPLLQHLIDQLVPDANGEAKELMDLCEQVAKEHGHYRSVHKQLKLAVEVRSSSTKKITWTQAFRSAHTMLIRNYPLN